jgi:hypothetical protein
MDQFPSNSRKATSTDEPKIERVTSVEPDRRKRGLGQKFKAVFIGGDARETREYVFFDVIIPAARDLIFDAFEAGMQRMIYGDNHRYHRRGGPSVGSNPGTVNYPTTNYGSMNRGQVASRPAQQRMLSRRSRARHDFDDIIIPSRQEAEEIIDQMFDILSRYGSVSLANLYALTGIQSSHTDVKWGWTALRGAKAVRLRQGGFLLDLPEPEELG